MKLTDGNWKHGLAAGLVLLVALMMTACDPKGTAARNRLGWLLDDNPDMTAEALLDSLDYFNGVTPDFSVHLPVTDADTRPHADIQYVNARTGTSISFTIPDSIDDAYGIGTISIRTGSENELTFHGTDTAVVARVHAWGRGIYSIYSKDSVTDEEGHSQLRIYQRSCLMFVYPGGDSILTTLGFKDSENIFRLKRY